MTGPSSQPQVLAVGRALPPHYASQDEIIAALQEAWSRAHYNADRLEELHRAVQVSGRYLALPIERYRELDTFASCNDAWQVAATDLAEQAVRDALDRAGLAPTDVDHLLLVTTTGIATPSLDARLMNRLGLRNDVRRTPIFGLGCAGGAAGLGRAADMLRAYPDQVAVHVATEVCSLTLQREDMSVANVIASGLFGDGAAAVVLAGADRVAEMAVRGDDKRDTGGDERSDERGDERGDGTTGGGAGPRILAHTASFYPDTEWVMGWDVVDTGFKVVLSAKVPEIVRTRVRDDVDGFLAAQGLARPGIDHWIVHTGGPRVLQAFAAALELEDAALERSWRSLSETGNLSSASVLFVLAELMDDDLPRAGDRGVLAAMGPGFGAELLLLGW